MKVRLTKTSMAKLPPCEGDKEHLVWDAELPGFGLRVSPKGKRTFFVQWRSPTGQGKRRLGDASIVDPDAARKEAKAILAKVQLGGDPQRDRRVERAKVAITFAPTVARYLSDHAEKALRPSTLSDVRRYLSVHFAPLNPLPLHEVTRAVVAARLAEIIKASGPTAANRGRAHLQAFFAWCMGEGLCDLNPVVGTNRATERGARARVLTNDELADVWHAANPNTDFGRIVRLLILTGSRREEVAGMRWPELTLVPAEKAAWTLPGSRAKNGREHLVPLSPAALDVIGAVIRRNDRDFLFGERTGPFAGFSKRAFEKGIPLGGFA